MPDESPDASRNSRYGGATPAAEVARAVLRPPSPPPHAARRPCGGPPASALRRARYPHPHPTERRDATAASRATSPALVQQDLVAALVDQPVAGGAEGDAVREDSRCPSGQRGSIRLSRVGIPRGELG